MYIFQICFWFTKINGAPKLGHALYDPLTYETIKHEQLEYNNPPHMQVKIQDFDGTDDDDFLENTDTEKETSAVLTSLRELRNGPRMQYTKYFESSIPSATASRLINKEIIQSITTTIEPLTMETKISSSLNNSILRKIFTTSLRKNASIKQVSTSVSENRNYERYIDIARTSCSSCVVNAHSNSNQFARQGDDQSSESLNLQSNPGESIKLSGYDYDDKLCKSINGRILCGYNKNHGEILRNTDTSDLNEDCRMRNDRIECGYVAENEHTKILRFGQVPNLTGTSIDFLNRKDVGTQPEPPQLPIFRGSSAILANGMDMAESIVYPMNDENNATDADLNVMDLNQAKINSEKDLTLGPVAVENNMPYTEIPTPMIPYSNTKPEELLNNYYDHLNDTIGNLDPTLLPEFPDNPDVFGEVTTVNENINFVADAQVEDRLDQGVQFDDANGPAFHNYDNNYVQNPNSVKKANESHMEFTSAAYNYKQVTRCVEIGDRVVCYNIQLRDVTPHM